MTHIALKYAILFLTIAILTLFSCSKSPPNPQSSKNHQEQLQSLQNQLESAQQEAKVAQHHTQETLAELHETQIKSTWITGFCVSTAVVCLFTGIGIGCKAKDDALNDKPSQKGGNTDDNPPENQTTQEAKSET